MACSLVLFLGTPHLQMCTAGGNAIQLCVKLMTWILYSPSAWAVLSSCTQTVLHFKQIVQAADPFSSCNILKQKSPSTGKMSSATEDFLCIGELRCTSRRIQASVPDTTLVTLCFLQIVVLHSNTSTGPHQMNLSSPMGNR